MYFVYGLNDYKDVEKEMEAFPGETRSVLKGRMDSLGDKTADIADRMDENKSGISRFFNEKYPLVSEKAQRIARSMGGVIRREPCGTDDVQLFFDTWADSIDNLLDEMDESDSDTRIYIVAHEMTISVLNELGMDSRDYIIKSNRRRDTKPLFEANGMIYGASFTFRYYKDIRFGFAISPDIEKMMFCIWVSSEASHLDYNDVVEYKKIVGVDQEDEDSLFEGLKNSRINISGDFYNRIIYGNIVDLETEVSEIHTVLYMVYTAYLALIQEVSGKVPMRKDNDDTLIGNIPIMPSDVAETVLSDRQRICDIDSTHELFEGEDGLPYTEVVPIIPINENTVKAYGDKIMTSANAAVLCPMCRAKLEHGSQRIKEDIILKLYDRHIDEMKECGMDASRTEIMLARYADKNPMNKSAVEKTMSYIRMASKLRGKEEG